MIPRALLHLRGRCANSFWISAPAENLLVLKTPPSGAQPLAAAVDASKFPEIAGTIAGDDTVLIITPSRKTRESLQKRSKRT